MHKEIISKILLSHFLIFLFLIFSCTSKNEKKSNEVLPAFMAHIDSSYSPVNNFYHWTVGKWLKNNPVPASEASWGSFNEVEENNKVILKSILEEAASTNAPNGSEQQKIGDLFKSGMDSVSINKQGIQTLSPLLSMINEINDSKQLVKVITELQAKGIQSIYYIYVGQDMMNSSIMVPYFGQNGISLPDKDDYLKQDEDSKRIRDEFLKHLTNVFQLMGDEFILARKQAEIVLAMETKMAEVSMDKLTMRDPYATYHKMSWDNFSDLTSEINWNEISSQIGLPPIDSIVVEQPEYFKGINALIKNEPINYWKVYMRWAVVSILGSYLSDDLVNEFFHFNGTILKGQKENKPRWERVMYTIENYTGMALGKLFVEKAFKPEAKQKVYDMVKNMQASFKDRLQNLDWMSAETKQKAIVKLEKFAIKIGYPDQWIDYSAMEIDPSKAYVANVMNAIEFEYKRNLNKTGKAVDKTEWLMPPHIVNAYYNPSSNEIVFPAGILQPPFFDVNADDAYNYGAIGAVIGHEMTHGFDDQGRQFDAEGNLKNWWTSNDSTKFVAKATLLVEEYNNCTVLDTIHVNGKYTLGENIADLGGIAIAFDAMKKSEAGRKNEMIGGLSAEQRFFMAWANSWKCNSTEEDQKHRIINDPHAPKEIRGYVPLTNMDAFHSSFGTKEGDKMYKSSDKRIAIW
jgi:putative endopeptidase